MRALTQRDSSPPDRRTCSLALFALALSTGCVPAASESRPEICNGVDDNEDGRVDESFGDLDGDGIADCVDTSCELSQPVPPVEVLCLGPDVPDAQIWDFSVERRLLLDERFGPVWPLGPVLYLPEAGGRDGTLYTRGYSSPALDPDAVVSTWLLDGSFDVHAAFEQWTAPILALDGSSVMPRLFGWSSESSSADIWFEELPLPGGAGGWMSPPVQSPYGLASGHEPPLFRRSDGTAAFVGAGHVIGLDGPYVALAPAVTQPTFRAEVADLDADGEEELLLGGWVFDSAGQALFPTGADSFESYFAYFDSEEEASRVLVVNDDGFVWLDGEGSQVGQSVRAPGFPRPPCVADFDGDGRSELGFVAGPAAGLDGWLGVLDLSTGEELWSVETEGGFGGCSAFDFDGDGASEIVHEGASGLEVRDGRTGELRLRHPIQSRVGDSVPTIVDIDSDGSVEILVASQGGDDLRGVWILGHPEDLWMPGASDSWPSQNYRPGDYLPNGELAPEPRVLGPESNFLRTMGPGAKPLPNLVPQLRGCASGCGPENNLQLEVSVQNTGSDVAAGPAVLELRDDSGAVLWSEVTNLDLAPGESSVPTSLSLPRAEIGDGGVRLRVVPTGDAPLPLECSKDDNEVAWGPGACP